MKRTIQLCTLALLTLGLGSSQAAIRISEVFANTPDGQTGREFVEIRGNANESLANLWLVVLEGVRPADGTSDAVPSASAAASRVAPRPAPHRPTPEEPGSTDSSSRRLFDLGSHRVARLGRAVGVAVRFV